MKKVNVVRNAILLLTSALNQGVIKSVVLAVIATLITHATSKPANLKGTRMLEVTSIECERCMRKQDRVVCRDCEQAEIDDELNRDYYGYSHCI